MDKPIEIKVERIEAIVKGNFPKQNQMNIVELKLDALALMLMADDAQKALIYQKVFE